MALTGSLILVLQILAYISGRGCEYASLSTSSDNETAIIPTGRRSVEHFFSSLLRSTVNSELALSNSTDNISLSEDDVKSHDTGNWSIKLSDRRSLPEIVSDSSEQYIGKEYKATLGNGSEDDGVISEIIASKVEDSSVSDVLVLSGYIQRKDLEETVSDGRETHGDPLKEIEEGRALVGGETSGRIQESIYKSRTADRGDKTEYFPKTVEEDIIENGGGEYAFVPWKIDEGRINEEGGIDGNHERTNNESISPDGRGTFGYFTRETMDRTILDCGETSGNTSRTIEEGINLDDVKTEYIPWKSNEGSHTNGVSSEMEGKPRLFFGGADSDIKNFAESIDRNDTLLLEMSKSDNWSSSSNSLHDASEWTGDSSSNSLHDASEWTGDSSSNSLHDASEWTGDSSSNSLHDASESTDESDADPNIYNGGAYILNDQEPYAVKLGDTTLMVCSKYLLCQNRCGTSPQSDSGGHPLVKSRARVVSADEDELDTEDLTKKTTENEDKTTRIDDRKRREVAKNKELGRRRKERIKQRTNNAGRKYSSENTRQRGTRDAEQVIIEPRCESVIQNATCFCDEACVMYGDCCVDVFQSCFRKTEAKEIVDFIYDIKIKLEIDTTMSLMNNEAITSKVLHNFVFHFASCERTDVGVSVLLVNRCPTWFTEASIKEKCEKQDMPLIPPVTATLNGGSVGFKNAFCAKCHGVREDSLKAWLVQLDCENEFINKNINTLTIREINNLVSSGECNVTFGAPQGACEPRHCVSGFRLSNEQEDILADNLQRGKCTLIDALICRTYYILRNGYKNPTCERCLNGTNQIHEIDVGIDMCNITYPFKTPTGDPITKDGYTPLTGGILIILDITGVYANRAQGPTFYICEDNQVFDPFFLKCKTLFCQPGFEGYRGQCVKSVEASFMPKSSQVFPNGWKRLDIITTTSDVDSYISCDEVLGQTQVKDRHSSFKVEKVLINDFQEIHGILPENSSTTLCSCEEYIIEQESTFLQTIDLILSLTHEPGLDTIEELERLAESLVPLASEEDVPQIVVTNMMKLDPALNFCGEGEVLTPRSDFILVEHKGVLYTVFNFTEEGIYYPLDSVGYEFIMNGSIVLNKFVTVLNTVYICQASQLLNRANCSTVEYSLNETLLNGSLLTILGSMQYYNEGDFDIRGNKVFVCSNFEFKVERKPMKQNVKYLIITCTFTGLSILFLFLMLVFYCVFPELRSLPGKMTASLALTMLLTFMFNMVSLVELHHDYMCPVMAVISHVVTLAHFGWMSAISVNMALAFGPGSKTLVKKQTDKKTFVIYNVVVWGTSVSIVLTSAILDFTHRDEITDTQTSADDTVSVISETRFPRYGYPFCTWFSGPLWTRLSFIVVPYFITYLISATGFVLTLVGIHETSKNSEKAGISTSDRSRCLIYIKLSTAMGFSWIISILINIYPQNDVLPYIYVCLVLLQGVLLFFGFMANKKICSLVAKRWFMKARGASSKDGTRISVIMSNSL